MLFNPCAVKFLDMFNLSTQDGSYIYNTKSQIASYS
jgi:hypothetical protein